MWVGVDCNDQRSIYHYTSYSHLHRITSTSNEAFVYQTLVIPSPLVDLMHKSCNSTHMFTVHFFPAVHLFFNVYALLTGSSCGLPFLLGGDRDEGEDVTGDLRRTESDSVLKKVGI